MDLADRLKEIAKNGNVDESKLCLTEIEDFLIAHKDHGMYEIRLSYENGVLNSIDLHCLSTRLANPTECPHYDPHEFKTFHSLVYHKKD